MIRIATKSRRPALLSLMVGLAWMAPLTAQASCPTDLGPIDLNSPVLTNGFDPRHENPRSYTEAETSLSAANVADLEVAWSFAFPDEVERRPQPVVTEQVVFVGSQMNGVYALDRETGCPIWHNPLGETVEEDFVRTPLTLGPKKGGRRLLYFGTQQGSVIALDAATGDIEWRERMTVIRRPLPISSYLLRSIGNLIGGIQVDPALLTGGFKLVGDRLYVPVASYEVISSTIPFLPCCYTSGSLVALDAHTGAVSWQTYTNERPRFNWHTRQIAPSGSTIWNTPTVDLKRNRIYVGTSGNMSAPASDTSDAIIAMNLDNGDIEWIFQGYVGDVHNTACGAPDGFDRNCPEPENAKDWDFGAPSILGQLPSGKEVLFAGQKSGEVFALDPDDEGRVLWSTRVGAGGNAGGVHHGMAYDGEQLYVPIADLFVNKLERLPDNFIGAFLGGSLAVPKEAVGITPGGVPGVYALDPETGDRIWDFTDEDQYSDNDAEFYSAAPTAIPGAVLVGTVGGRVQALSKEDGSLLWEYNTVRDFVGPDGTLGRGGSVDVAGPVVAGDMVFVNSGYGMWSEEGSMLVVFRLP